MSLLTQAHLLDRYGPRLNVEQVAQALGITSKALHNQRSAGSFGIPMYLDGGKLWADYRDVAAYFDSARAAAA
jgi:hypothetical protein